MSVKNRALVPGCWLAVGLLSVACGAMQATPVPVAPEEGSGTEAPASAPALANQEASTDRSEPATLAEAEQLLDRARQDLDRLALAEPVPSASATAGAAPSPAYAPPPRDADADAARKKAESKRAEARSSADDAAPASAPAKEQDVCESACKAFSSLERASAAVCRLDSAGGPRCLRARQIREDASRRVASCGCAG